VGELDLEPNERAEMKENPLSKIVFFDDDEELFVITRLFLQVPFEHGAMGVVGKRYDAIKDILTWHDIDLKTWVFMMHRMGNVWAGSQKSKN